MTLFERTRHRLSLSARAVAQRHVIFILGIEELLVLGCAVKSASPRPLQSAAFFPRRKRVREGGDAHVDHAVEARKSDAQPATETVAVATSTGEVLDFDRDRDHGGVCVGEDVPGVDAAASKQAWGVAVGGAIAAGEEGADTEPNSPLAAESVEHTVKGAPPHQDTQAPVPPVGER
jgi:hypothetical protein